MSERRQFCTFHLDSQYFGLDVLKVQEVVRNQPYTRVPLASPVVQGVINLRGQIVAAIDLRKRLEMPEREPASDSVSIVVQTDDGAVSLSVDQIGDVLEVDQDLFEPPPETVRGAVRDLILGAYKLPERLLVILSPEKIVTVP